MKKLIIYILLCCGSMTYGQTLKQTIDANLLNQGSKGITSTKLRAVFNKLVDSLHIYTPIGASSLTTDASGNLKIGVLAGNSFNGSSSNNIAIGLEALKTTTQSDNISIGSYANRNNTGQQNVSIGNSSLINNTGSSNVAIGFGALGKATANTGQFNTAVGVASGDGIDSGTYNTFIGYYSGSSSYSQGSSITNSLAIGNQAVTTASNQVVIGNASITDNLFSGKFRLRALNTAPSSATDTGTLGEIRYTATHIYVCTATNTWVRVALATW